MAPLYLAVSCGHCQDHQKSKPAFLYPLSVVLKDQRRVLLKTHVLFSHLSLVQACTEITGVKGENDGLPGWSWTNLQKLSVQLLDLIRGREVVTYNATEVLAHLKLGQDADCERVCLKKLSHRVPAHRLRKAPWDLLTGDVRALPSAVCDAMAAAHAEVQGSSSGEPAQKRSKQAAGNGYVPSACVTTLMHTYCSIAAVNFLCSGQGCQQAQGRQCTRSRQSAAVPPCSNNPLFCSRSHAPPRAAPPANDYTDLRCAIFCRQPPLCTSATVRPARMQSSAVYHSCSVSLPAAATPLVLDPPSNGPPYMRACTARHLTSICGSCATCIDLAQ